MTDYVVLYEQAEDGDWGAYLPDLPGVVALGKSRVEVEARIKEAVAAHLEFERDGGVSRPAPAHQAGTIRL
ncbi:MAG: type II toxin-antitoxin system HicB family antitoxin [Solirubrobacterales bacterium]|nr:type II toxin-antitoxin system HicB family antitoxin [Solirubrobacterales bacterium]